MALVKRVCAGLVVWLIMATQYSFGFTMTFSEGQLNTMVKAVFPQQRTYDNVLFTFSDPVVELDPLEDEVNVKVTVLAQQHGKQLRARAEINGQVAYHSELAQLRIIEPRLDKLTILEDQAMAPQDLIDGIKRLEGKRMPVILLIDFEQLDLAAWGIKTPKRIDITPGGLLIEI